jgi:DNA-binding transcriptional regulator/RsmH inhibitor MraZ
VSIIGRGAYLEIWDTRRFEEYTGSGEDFDEVYYKTIRSGVFSDE